MELKDFEERYKGFTTDKLKELAEGHKEMREDVIPILLAELESRGEVQFVENIKIQIDKSGKEDHDDLATFGTLLNTEDMNYDFSQKSETLDDLLDDEESPNFTAETFKAPAIEDFKYSQSDLIKKAINLVIKEKSTIANWQEAKFNIREQWDIDSDTMRKIHGKLDRRRSNNLYFGSFLIIVFLIGIIMLVATEGQLGFLPGILFGFWAYNSLITAKHLKRILWD